MSRKLLSLIGILTMIFLGLIFFMPDESLVVDRNVQPKTQTVKENKSSDKQKKQEVALPPVRSTDWNLILVNDTHPIKEENKRLISLPNGYEVDERVLQPYLDMEAAAKKDGIQLTVISSYRSVAYQEQIYKEAYDRHINEGQSPDEAKQSTAAYMTTPGESEHHTGLALDVVDQDWYNSGQGLEEEFIETPAGKWIQTHCPEYGFIVRYPPNKESITKINYEPWHIRYVGRENAEYITKHQLALEEYIDLIKEEEKVMEEKKQK